MGADYSPIVRTALPAGPALPPVVQIALWAFRPVPFLRSCGKKYGDTFTIRFPAYPPFVFTSDPGVVADAFSGDPATFLTGQGNRILKPLLGEESLLLLDGEKHHRRRRAVMPPFHGAALKAAGEGMREVTLRHLERWPADRVRPVLPGLAALTLEVIVETVIGVRDGARRDLLCATLTRLLALGTRPGVFFFVGRSGDVRLSGLQKRLGRMSPLGMFLERKRAVSALLHEEIARRRREGERGGGVLALLLRARAEDGSALTGEELHDELMTLLVAGHETTATALAWILHRLATHPDVRARAVAEADAGVESRYLDAVILETLRLHPVVPLVVRRLAEARTVGGLPVPAGAIVSPNIWMTHRRPDLWPDPERFDPGRFLGPAPRPHHFFPFGGGNRICVGRAFALQEMRIVLGELLRRRLPGPAPGYAPRVVRRGVTFAPSRGLPLLLQRRSGSQPPLSRRERAEAAVPVP
jgi:cytochrome P450